MNRTQTLVLGFFVVVWVSLLQFTGTLASNVPAWYVVFQGLLGAVQAGIGLAMVAGYRRAGTWGAL